MHVISIAAQKGGVGKTTTTVNLATAFRERGKNPLVIDMDSQMNATHWLMGRLTGENEASIYDVLSTVSTDRHSKYRLENLIKSSDSLGVDFAQSGEMMTEFQLRGVVEEADSYPFQLRERLEELENSSGSNYDVCLIDCPPSLGSPVVLSLTASDEVIAPLTADNFSVRGLDQLFSTVRNVQSNTNSELSVLGILINDIDRRRSMANDLVEATRENYGDYVFDTTMPWRAKIEDAGTVGRSLYDLKPNGDAAQYYLDLAGEVISRIEQRSK